MAYDKVVDSAVLDAGLKQIADAIREKGGTTDNLTFPTAMADAIAALSSGGGGLYTETVTYAANTEVSRKTIQHNLGAVPNLFAIVSNAPGTTTGAVYLGAMWLYCFDVNSASTYVDILYYKPAAQATYFQDTMKWMAESSSDKANGGQLIGSDNSSGTTRVYNVNETSAAFNRNVGQQSTLYFQAGATYTYIVGVI